MRIKRGKKLSVSAIFVMAIILLLSLATFLYYNYNSKIVGDKHIAVNSVSVNTTTSLRTGPNTSYPEIIKINTGDILEKRSESGDWVEVKTLDNKLGWVASWHIVGSDKESPESQMKDRLKDYSLLINPIYVESVADYNLEISKLLKTQIENLGIKVVLTREDSSYDDSHIKQIISSTKSNLVININLFTENDYPNGVSLYYSNAISSVVTKYLEKNLVNNSLFKINNAKKHEGLVTPFDEKTPEILLTLANTNSKIDMNMLAEDIYKKELIYSVTKGIEEYFYYDISLNDYYEKRRENLKNATKKGMDIPYYYTSFDENKNIAYGNTGSKTIMENGDAIVALAMIENYLDPNHKNSVEDIAKWAGNKYFSAGTTSYLIAENFAKQYDLKTEYITKSQFSKIDEALASNKPVLLQMSTGLFGEKINYKVLRGKEDGLYYLNDPNDDDVKLNSYTGFTRANIENNLLKAWAFSK